MDSFDQIYTFRFTRPREYFRATTDGRLYEVVRVPPSAEDLLTSKSPFLHEIAWTFEENRSIYSCIRFNLSRNLEYILLKNASLEETYIALIIKSVADLVVQIHAKGLFGIHFAPSNFSLLPGGKIVVRNRFSLNCHTRREADDWSNFCGFVERIAPGSSKDEKNSAISRNFRLFWKTLETLRSKDSPVAAKFSELLTSPFLNKKANFLDDLLDDSDQDTERETTKLIGVEVKPVGPSEHLESAGNAFDLSGERSDRNSTSDDRKKHELFYKAMSTVFEKYRGDESIRGKQVPDLLTAIENALKTMELAEPFSALRMMQALTGAPA